MTALLKVSNITKVFGDKKVVNDISFTASKGEVVGFLGPNGAGKSTTMKMITGFLTPTSGEAYVNGHNVHTDPQAAKAILGYLPEGAPAYPEMQVNQFLNFIAEIRGYRGQAKIDRIAQVVSKVNLDSVLSQPIDTLSKGFKRRLGLAQALIHDPDVLVLDEPTDGLDPNQKHEVRELILAMAKEKTIILSTHILEEVDAVCDRVIVVANGSIISDCTPAELAEQSPFHNTIQVSVRNANQEQIIANIGGLKEVGKLEWLDNFSEDRVTFCIHPLEAKFPVEILYTVASKQGWELEDFQLRRGQLDEVFRSITQSTRNVS